MVQGRFSFAELFGPINSWIFKTRQHGPDRWGVLVLDPAPPPAPAPVFTPVPVPVPVPCPYPYSNPFSCVMLSFHEDVVDDAGKKETLSDNTPTSTSSSRQM